MESQFDGKLKFAGINNQMNGNVICTYFKDCRNTHIVRLLLNPFSFYTMLKEIDTLNIIYEDAY